MKAVLFLLSFWSCFFAVTDAIDCFIAPPDITLFISGCKACGYHSVNASSDPTCEAKELYLCLHEPSIEYEDSSGKHIFNTIGQCSVETEGSCNQSLYICQTDKCNTGCGGAPSNSSSLLLIDPTPSTSTSPTTAAETTTTPSATTPTESSHENIEG